MMSATRRADLGARQKTIARYIGYLRIRAIMIQDSRSLEIVTQRLKYISRMYEKSLSGLDLTSADKELTRKISELLDRLKQIAGTERGRRGMFYFIRRPLFYDIREELGGTPDVDASTKRSGQRLDLKLGPVQALRRPLRLMLAFKVDDDRLAIDTDHWNNLYLGHGAKSRRTSSRCSLPKASS